MSPKVSNLTLLQRLIAIGLSLAMGVDPVMAAFSMTEPPSVSRRSASAGRCDEEALSARSLSVATFTWDHLPFFLQLLRHYPSPAIRLMVPSDLTPRPTPFYPMLGSTLPGVEPLDPDAATREAWERLATFLIVKDALPEQADGMLIFGNDLLDLPRAAAVLAQRLSIRLVVPTGGRGRLTPPDWVSEAESFAEAIHETVPKLMVRPEASASTTHENAKFGWRILKAELGEIRSVIGIQFPIQSLRAKKMLEFVLEANGLVGSDRPHLVFHPVIETDFDTPLPDWPLAFWRQRLLFEAMGEIGGLLAWQNPVDGNIARTLIPANLLEDAMTIARFLLLDPSIPQAEKDKIQSRGMATIRLHQETPPAWSPVVRPSVELFRREFTFKSSKPLASQTFAFEAIGHIEQVLRTYSSLEKAPLRRKIEELSALVQLYVGKANDAFIAGQVKDRQLSYTFTQFPSGGIRFAIASGEGPIYGTFIPGRKGAPQENKGSGPTSGQGQQRSWTNGFPRRATGMAVNALLNPLQVVRHFRGSAEDPLTQTASRARHMSHEGGPSDKAPQVLDVPNSRWSLLRRVLGRILEATPPVPIAKTRAEIVKELPDATERFLRNHVIEDQSQRVMQVLSEWSGPDGTIIEPEQRSRIASQLVDIVRAKGSVTAKQKAFIEALGWQSKPRSGKAAGDLIRKLEHELLSPLAYKGPVDVIGFYTAHGYADRFQELTPALNRIVQVAADQSRPVILLLENAGTTHSAIQAIRQKGDSEIKKVMHDPDYTHRVYFEPLRRSARSHAHRQVVFDRRLVPAESGAFFAQAIQDWLDAHSDVILVPETSPFEAWYNYLKHDFLLIPAAHADAVETESLLKEAVDSAASAMKTRDEQIAGRQLEEIGNAYRDPVIVILFGATHSLIHQTINSQKFRQLTARLEELSPFNLDPLEWLSYRRRSEPNRPLSSTELELLSHHKSIAYQQEPLYNDRSIRSMDELDNRLHSLYRANFGDAFSQILNEESPSLLPNLEIQEPSPPAVPSGLQFHGSEGEVPGQGQHRFFSNGFPHRASGLAVDALLNPLQAVRHFRGSAEDPLTQTASRARHMTNQGPVEPENPAKSVVAWTGSSLVPGKTYSRHELERHGVPWPRQWGPTSIYNDLEDAYTVIENVLASADDAQTQAKFGRRVNDPVPIRVLGLQALDRKTHIKASRLLILDERTSQWVADAAVSVEHDAQGEYYQLRGYDRPSAAENQGLIHRMITLIVLSGRVRRWRSDTWDWMESPAIRLYRRLEQDTRLSVKWSKNEAGEGYCEVIAAPAALASATLENSNESEDPFKQGVPYPLLGTPADRKIWKALSRISGGVVKQRELARQVHYDQSLISRRLPRLIALQNQRREKRGREWLYNNVREGIEHFRRQGLVLTADQAAKRLRVARATVYANGFLELFASPSGGGQSHGLKQSA